MIIRSLKYLILLALTLGWFYMSLPSMMLLVIGPYYVINNWMGGSIPLTVLFLDGWVAAMLLLVKPLLRADAKVRAINEAARKRADKGVLAKN